MSVPRQMDTLSYNIEYDLYSNLHNVWKNYFMREQYISVATGC